MIVWLTLLPTVCPVLKLRNEGEKCKNKYFALSLLIRNAMQVKEKAERCVQEKRNRGVCRRSGVSWKSSRRRLSCKVSCGTCIFMVGLRL